MKSLQYFGRFDQCTGGVDHVVHHDAVSVFYLANHVKLETRNAGGQVYFELELEDAWVWDIYRPVHFVAKVRVLTFKDVNIEETKELGSVEPAKDIGTEELAKDI